MFLVGFYPGNPLGENLPIPSPPTRPIPKPMTLSLSAKPDYEKSLQRIEAFWQGELIARPVVQFYLPRPIEEQVPLPPSHHATSAERWLDTQYQVDLALASCHNQEYLGDTLPVFYPNLGPEVFSALYGCPMHFGDYGTSWTDPVLNDWAQADRLVLDWHHPYLQKLHEMTDALIEAGKGLFITGMTDWHAGGDAIAAFRDPINLAVDMIEHRPEVNRLLARVEADYFKLYEVFYEKLRRAGLPITSWTFLVHEGRYYIPSNDFSIMLSRRMFDEIFLPGIRRECQYYERSIYHLDGPGALRHLDSILAIPELNAVQYVYGAGNEGIHQWMGVYQKIQKAGKGIQVNCRLEEVPLAIQNLDPHGLFLNVEGVLDRDSAQAMLRELERWK